MSQFPEITSNLSTANFRASVLTQLNQGIEISNDVGNPIPVTISGSTGATNYELVVSTYTCKTAFTGASVGDIITETQIIAITGGVASTLQTIWRNQTTATDLSSAPSSVNLALEGTTALTQAQLQATAVAATQSGTWSVGVNNFPTSTVISNNVGNPVPVSGSFYQATQPVSGTVTANVQGGNSTAVKVDGSAVTQPVSGTVTVSNPQTSVSITGTPTVSVQGGNSTAVKVDGSAVTQPVSGTVSVSGGSVTITGGIPAGSNVIGGVTLPAASAPVYGQQTSTGTATSLPSNTLTSGIVLTNIGTTNAIWVGGSGLTTSNGYSLAPGASVGLVVSNTSSIYILQNTGVSTLSFIGS
jgi:hypothetical protein